MIKVLIDVSRYVFVALFAIYLLMSYRIFTIQDEEDRSYRCVLQNMIMFLFHFLAYGLLFISSQDFTYVWLYLAQMIIMFLYLVIFHLVYKNADFLLLNNMCMMIMIGFIMISRINMEEGIRQTVLVFLGMYLTLIVPVFMQKNKKLRNIPWLYGVIGIVLLLLVLLVGQAQNGANLSIKIFGITFQFSEFIKIVYAFFIAAMFNRSTKFGNVVLTTGLAAVHVLILVISKDLGGALIYFVVYLVMVYVATKKAGYIFLGGMAGVVASMAAYHLFAHVRTRVYTWQDPWSYIDGEGYQITQSIFAIGTGGWFGEGLYQGMPYRIPMVEMDFMFSAICEEFGIIFGVGIILLMLNTFLLMMDVGMKSQGKFYRLLSVGLATAYGFQIFLTIGGGIKFIPLTGVTLPLISYGGSSAWSTLLLFAVIQGLYRMKSQDK